MIRITTRLVLAFLSVSILPLTAVGYAGLQMMDRVRTLTTNESTEALRQLGQAAIHQQAVHVARQVELYLQAHPELLALAPNEWPSDPQLRALAVQPVGATGYTAVFDRNGITHFHADPGMIGRDMSELATSLPAFWEIFEASLDGTTSEGYYDWKDANGSTRAKYMSCVPVGGTALRVAATTYIDEFYQPMRQVESRITQISEETLAFLFVALILVGLAAVGLALWLAWGISRPVSRLTLAAGSLEQGRYEPAGLAAEMRRRDDLGQLARVFDRMAQEVKSREERLRSEVQALRIEIDQSRKTHQVAEITETEYFQKLRAKARDLRKSASEQESIERPSAKIAPEA